jgi:hypothetical protein
MSTTKKAARTILSIAIGSVFVIAAFAVLILGIVVFVFYPIETLGAIIVLFALLPGFIEVSYLVGETIVSAVESTKYFGGG